MKKLLIYILTAFTVLTLPASAKIPASQRIRLTDQWEYLKGDLGSIWAVSYTHLTLPTNSLV